VKEINNSEEDVSICKIDSHYLKEKIFKLSETNKDIKRPYLYLKLYDSAKGLFLIPFESKLSGKNPIAEFRLPTEGKPDAGLNFEKVIIIPKEDYRYIKENSLREAPMPRKQTRILRNPKELKKLYDKFSRYIRRYKIALKKGREYKEHIFRYSTLHNYKHLFQ